MALDWSFSVDKKMRRCQRQLFFGNIAAWHNSRDVLRRESFVLSQLKSLDAWRGSLVHTAIQNFVVPCWQTGKMIPWDRVVDETRELATRQIEFSERRRYRETGLSKKKAGDAYCALFGHEFGCAPTAAEFAQALDSVERSLRNLEGLSDFIKHVQGRSYYRAEIPLGAEYNDVRIQGVVDLLFGRAYGQYGVVDWKDYTASSTTDAKAQMSLYAWLLCKSSAWPVSAPQNIELWEVNMGLPLVKQHHINGSDFDELEDFMYRSTERLRALCGDGAYRAADLENYECTENPNSCRFCPYQKLCREPEPWITTASTSTKSKTPPGALSITSLFKLSDLTATV